MSTVLNVAARFPGKRYHSRGFTLLICLALKVAQHEYVPRKKTGQVLVERHGDHFDVRLLLPSGVRTTRRHLEPGVSLDEAKAFGRAGLALARESKGTPKSVPDVADVPNQVAPNAKGETVDTWAYRWLAERQARGLASFAVDEGRYRKWIFPVLGALEIAKVVRLDLERFVEQLDNRVRASELSWKTARHVWAVVSKMFSDACRSKRLDLRVREDNPAKEVRGPDAGVTKAKTYLYPDELLAVVNCATVPIRWKRLFTLATYTYMRPGELEALEWSDVDLERGTIHIHRALAKDGTTKATKTKVTRRIPIEPALVPLLTTMKAEGGDRVIASMPPECDLSKRLREYVKRSGVTRAELFANDATRKQLRFYDLRASGISWMALRGDEPLRIMQRAGHSEFSTTMQYVREAETFGDVGTPFPPLPSLAITEPETPSTWGALKGANDPTRIPPRKATRRSLSGRNDGVPSGIRTRVAALKGLSPGPG